MSTVKDGLIACVTRWLPVLDEPELRAVEGFVLELVIAARERAIDLSAREQAATPVVPHDAMRADAISRVELALVELRDADAIDTRPSIGDFDVGDLGGEGG